MTDAEKIINALRKAELSVKAEEDEDNFYLYIKRKPTSKKTLFELCFTHKGKLTNLIAGKKETNVAWLDVQLKSRKS